MIQQIPRGKKVIQIAINVSVPNEMGAWSGHTITLVADKDTKTADVLALALGAVTQATAADAT